MELSCICTHKCWNFINTLNLFGDGEERCWKCQLNYEWHLCRFFFLSKNYFDLTNQIFMIVSFCNITANKRRNFEVGKIELGVKEQSQ